MEIPTQNVIAVFNQLVPTTGNLIFGAANDIPPGNIDFESTLLHEMGHSLGLAHPNAATESGLTGVDRNYTKATFGLDSAFNLDDGADNLIGSADDLRGDDENLHYFRISNNDPFTIDATVDGSTYSRELVDLPGADLFSANADRDLGDALGYTNTECVMQQGAFFDEAQRTLGHDDVAGIRYAMAGVDETAGNGDDYTINLIYAGLDSTADIVIDFDTAETSFAVSKSSGILVFTGTEHYVIGSNRIFFNPDFDWNFNTTVLPVEWAHFAVHRQGSDAALYWATSAEVNHDYFEIQRSVDQQAWQPIASVNSEQDHPQGKSYRYLDPEADRWGNELYYRIKQVDLNGATSFSKVQKVIFKRERSEATTFGPIPLRPNTFVEVYLLQAEDVKVQVVDLQGKLLRQQQFFGSAGVNRFTVGQTLVDLPRGVYVLRVQGATFQQTYKFTR